MSLNYKYSFIALVAIVFSCQPSTEKKETTEMSKEKFTGAKGEVKIMTLDPGHFHAALVQNLIIKLLIP